MASAVVTFCWLLDLLGSLMGALLNVLLLAAILRSSHRKQAYSFMFLFTACFDFAYSLLELAIQHLLTAERGVLVIMPHGLERFFPPSIYVIIFFHIFLVMNSIFILPCQYKYRYDILKNPHTTVRSLIVSVSVASGVAALCGANAVWMVVEQQRRPAVHYERLLEADDVDGREFYLYGFDIEDISTKCFYYGSAFMSSNAALILCAFYLWKSVRFVHEQQDAISDQTRSLARQFKISLIVQTVNSLVWAVSPISLLTMSIIFRVRFLSAYTMLPVAWLPAVVSTNLKLLSNALTTLTIIKPYKRYVASLFCGKSASVSSLNTGTVVSNLE
ncbi:hypothetical protein M3Y99_00911200 [Aphelenchoides fujianensis]|nr:hypothetical protein M3Y99_01012500 [Aphelenchoides fujianensis]KAI6233423.1 hypothetical protein M3Y99_00911200 [Aphelenchoides fujianensis]